MQKSWNDKRRITLLLHQCIRVEACNLPQLLYHRILYHRYIITIVILERWLQLYISTTQTFWLVNTTTTEIICCIFLMDNTIFMCTLYVTKSYIGGNEPNYANGFEVYGPGQCCGTHSGSLHYNPRSCKYLNSWISQSEFSMLAWKVNMWGVLPNTQNLYTQRK